MDYASQIMIAYNSKGYKINKKSVRKLISYVLSHNAPIGHHSEVAWALWLARCLNVIIPEPVARTLGSVESSVCALLALDCYTNRLIPKGLDLSRWRASQCADGLRDRYWLLSYEANFKGWLPELEAGFVENDKFFADVKAKGVYFYEEKIAAEPFGIAQKKYSTYQEGEGAAAQSPVFSIFSSIVTPYEL